MSLLTCFLISCSTEFGSVFSNQEDQSTYSQETQYWSNSNSLINQSQLAENTIEFSHLAKDETALQKIALPTNNEEVVYAFKNQGVFVCNLEELCLKLNFSLSKIDGILFDFDRKLLTGYYLKELEVLDLFNNKVIDRVALRENISTVTYSFKEPSLYMGTLTGNVYKLYYLAKSQKEVNYNKLTRYTGHSSVIRNIVVHPTDRVFFSSDSQGILSSWLTFDAKPFDFKKEENIFEPNFWSDKTNRMIAKLVSPTTEMLIRADGKYLLLALKNGAIEIWAVRGFKKVCSIDLYKSNIKSVQANKDWSKIYTIGRDGKEHHFNLSPLYINEEVCNSYNGNI